MTSYPQRFLLSYYFFKLNSMTHLHRAGTCSACSCSHFSHLSIDVYFFISFLTVKKTHQVKTSLHCVAARPPKDQFKTTIIIYSSPVKQHKTPRSQQSYSWAGSIQALSPLGPSHAGGHDAVSLLTTCGLWFPRATAAAGEAQQRWCLSCNQVGQREGRCEGRLGNSHGCLAALPPSLSWETHLGTSLPFEISFHDSQHFHNTNALKPFFQK